MRLLQQETEFQPIAVVLENKIEAIIFWQLIEESIIHRREFLSEPAKAIGIQISNFLSEKTTL